MALEISINNEGLPYHSSSRKAAPREGASDLKQEVVSRVGSLYERFPYPHYPLLGKPRWQDAYLGSALFCQALARKAPPTYTLGSRFLSVGSGEILPLLIKLWEPRQSQLTCVELSGRSIRRARTRLLMRGLSAEFAQEDIDLFIERHLKNTRSNFHHVEAYGVLHHLSDPGHTWKSLAASLPPGGTMRVMVYNSEAREWLWQLQKCFQLLRLSAFTEGHLATAQKILSLSSEAFPAIGERLKSMGPSIWQNPTRFADTFLHPHELHLPVERWIKMGEEAGLRLVGVYDRYGELDDLPNPLWNAPTADELAVRAEDLRFENNLELYWIKPAGKAFIGGDLPKIRRSLWLKAPPRKWTQFHETRGVGNVVLWQIWHRLLTHLSGRTGAVDDVVGKMPLPAAQRLARIGAILPGQCIAVGLKEKLQRKMYEKMEPPKYERKVVEVLPQGLVQAIETAARGAKQKDKIVEQVKRRLRKAAGV